MSIKVEKGKIYIASCGTTRYIMRSNGVIDEGTYEGECWVKLGGTYIGLSNK